MATERAIFAGGCFWCMVQPFEEVKEFYRSRVVIQVEMLKIQLTNK